MARKRIDNSKMRRDERKKSASERQKVREARSPAEQLAELDTQLGGGIGAKRERARLNAIVTKEKLIEKFSKAQKTEQTEIVAASSKKSDRKAGSKKKNKQNFFRDLEQSRQRTLKDSTLQVIYNQVFKNIELLAKE